jgi:hypothetical protein
MQLSDMSARVSQRLAEGSAAAFYPKAEIVAALNEALRLFSLLTLGLETTKAWNVPAATTFFHMLTYYPDWIVPLRLTDSAGAKVRPSRFGDLTSLDSGWISSPTPAGPYRYVAEGADFVAIYPQPMAIGQVINVTYARAPLALVSDTDVPEIPQEYHPRLVEYGVYRVRQVEGGQEFAKTLPMLGAFLDGAQNYADYVRARNKGSRYDAVPFELSSFDRSALMKGAGGQARRPVLQE